jgi:uncharacterized membrane protein YsdA (DUF1294 family)
MNRQYLPLLLFLLSLFLSYIYGYTPLLVVAIFLVISLVAFVVYYKDKDAACRGAWRTPESTLHLLALLCGWPGALIAQQTLRHKTQKRSFRVVFWLTVMVNVGAFVWLHTSEGSRLLRDSVYRLDGLIPYSSVPDSVSLGLQQLTRFHVRN